MKERIFGTECEYALSYQSNNKKDKPPAFGEDLLEYLKGLISFILLSLNEKNMPRAGEFLGNGGRFYIDRGGHPEYATPECRSIRDLVIHEKAGDRLVQELVEDARRLIVEKGGSPRFHIFKNNVDAFGTSYGAHENYLITHQAMDQIEATLPFFVSRQVYTGAGHVTAKKTSRDVPYQLSQRADHFNCVFSDRTSEVRGIINIRKREIHQSGQNRRLHVIVGDCNMSEYAIALKNGATALVLRLLEAGALTHIPRLASPVHALRLASRSMHAPLEMESGGSRYSALEIQAIYLEKVERYYASRALSPEEKMILEMWEEVLMGLKGVKISDTWDLEEDPGNLKRKIDWLLKLWLLNRYRTGSGLEWHDKRLKVLDFRYHDLDPATGLFQHCQTVGLVDRMVTEDEIHAAKTQPPRDTRAWTRGRVIQQSMDKKVAVEVENWEKINIRTQSKNTGPIHPFLRHRPVVNALEIRMKDPFQAENTGDTEKLATFLEKFG